MLDRFIARFIAIAPQLSTLRMAFHQPLREVHQTYSLPDHVMPHASRKLILARFVPSLPNSLASLRCIQRGEGYRVRYDSHDLAIQWGFATGQKFAEFNPRDEKYIMYHEVRKVGVYL